MNVVARAAVQAAPASMDALAGCEVHHIGFLVHDMARSMARFAPFFPVVTVDAVHHAGQRVTVTMMESADGRLRAELVSPDASNALMQRQMNRFEGGASPYHICFLVQDFATSAQRLSAQGWRALTRPFDTHYAGWRASHMFHPDAGMIEIMG